MSVATFADRSSYERTETFPTERKRYRAQPALIEIRNADLSIGRLRGYSHAVLGLLRVVGCDKWLRGPYD
jgi:hypothetical protein